MKDKYLIAGNWKMHLDPILTVELIEGILKEVEDVLEQVDVMVCPPFTSLQAGLNACRGTRMLVGAQNMFWEESGAFTGEISPLMLQSLGVGYVLLGHSERRHIFGESDDLIQKKLDSALSHDIHPILCIGETLEERQQGETFSVLDTQLKSGLGNVSGEHAARITLAYEPVWAIGTGVTASPQQAQEAHAHVRQVSNQLLGQDAGTSVRILYGGSVKAENAAELLGQPDVDGALVGGASLKANGFAGIIRAALSL